MNHHLLSSNAAAPRHAATCGSPARPFLQTPRDGLPADGCGSASHWRRRTLLKAAGLSGLAWLTPLSYWLARAEEVARPPRRAKSVILLWLAGGPSQLETFDPHPGATISEGTRAIATRAPGIQLATGLERIAEAMDSLSIIRNVVSKEGDHERATYNVKTGYRPDPTLVHPALGAIICHQLPVGTTEIPRHVSILPGASPGRGGYLGDRYDAFKTGDPSQPVPDVSARVNEERFARRLEGLSAVDASFYRGRLQNAEAERTSHRATVDNAIRMMSSEQLAAFDVSRLPRSEREEFGDTAFGRACLAASQLIEVGVRCVEVTLSGWDSHVDNHRLHDNLKAILDPALAALVGRLQARDRWHDTILLCGGEFGRTPQMNPAGGRDHWPHGFSIAVGGGGFPGGMTLGETAADGSRVSFAQGTPIADLHATMLHLLGIDHLRELETPVGRPMKLSEGKVIPQFQA
jgi:hypothetical protein